MKNGDKKGYIPRKVNSFNPDSLYIKIAIAEFKRKGGKISKSDSGNGSFSDIMKGENLHSEP